MYNLAKLYTIHNDCIFSILTFSMGISIRAFFIFLIKSYPYRYPANLECMHIGPWFLKSHEELVHAVSDIRDAIY